MAIEMIDTQRPFGEVEIGELHGQLGLEARLVINLNVLPWDVEEQRAATLRRLEADVFIQGDGQPERLVGRAFAADQTAGLRQFRTRAKTRFALALDLTHRHLDAWERIRAGRSFSLHLRYYGLAWSNIGLDNVRGYDTRVVSQSEWVKVLEQVGFRRTVLLEVPIPDEASHPALALATQELANATGALVAGRSRDVVSACRLALEALGHALGEDAATYNLAEVVKRNTTLSKAERFAILRKALTAVTNASHHADANAASIEWDYDDAVVLLAETAAVLRYHSAVLSRTAR